ncbi:MAG: cytochrome c3 family protein, partial [Planctomycetota bacterium]
VDEMTSMPLDGEGTGFVERWIHDNDVHLQSGMKCVDCHRNGIDHLMVRGFEGQAHPDSDVMQTLSCTGCHLGVDQDDAHTLNHFTMDEYRDKTTLATRLGSPMPLHEGLPAVHFDRLSCTACHGGTVPREESIRAMTSLAHGLGEKKHWTGEELPLIATPVFAKLDDGKIYPMRAMWPAFWGYMEEGNPVPLPPEEVYDVTRKSLRVRKNFVEEVFLKKPEEGWEQFEEKTVKGLVAIRKEFKVEQPAYVSAGVTYGLDDTGEALTVLEESPMQSMVRWPLAHNVRPAGWSLGTGGCVECHADDGRIFASTVNPLGPVRSDVAPRPEEAEPVDLPVITMASIQGIEDWERMIWNQLFQGRATFKYVIAASMGTTLLCICIAMVLGVSRKREVT